LQKLIGLPSKKIEDVLGKAAEVVAVDPLGSPAGAATGASAGDAASGAAATTSGNTTAGAASPSQSSSGGTTAAGEGAVTADAAASAGGLKLQMNYPNYQLSLILEASATNPKEALVSTVLLWGSKPLSLIVPPIEATVKDKPINDDGYRTISLQGAGTGSTYINQYFRDNFMYSVIHDAATKIPNQLEIIALEPASR
jgi:hypothetical protein